MPREQQQQARRLAEAGAKEIERIKAAEAKGIRFVQLQFTDIMGIVKAVTIPIHRLYDSVAHGTWFDGSSTAIFCSRRASARSFSTCLNSSCVVDPMTRTVSQKVGENIGQPFVIEHRPDIARNSLHAPRPDGLDARLFGRFVDGAGVPALGPQITVERIVVIGEFERIGVARAAHGGHFLGR